MPPVFHFRQYRSYIKSPGISSLQIHTESLFYSKSPTKPYWADPSTFCIFILNNKAKYRSYIKSPGISSLQIHTESLFYSKSPTKPYWADPSTFCIFILNNKAIWIQTTAQLFTRFSVPIYRKTLDFTTFSAITIFISRYTSLSKVQNNKLNHLFHPASD